MSAVVSSELLQLIHERGILLEKEVFDLLNRLPLAAAATVLGLLEQLSGKKYLTKVMLKNYEPQVRHVLQAEKAEQDARQQSQIQGERVSITLGVQLDIERKMLVQDTEKVPQPMPPRNPYRVHTSATQPTKKLEVEDFVTHFRSRYHFLQRILMQRVELKNLISINKLSSSRQQASVIGMVREKRVTKNHNTLLLLEDLTGEIQALVRSDKPELAAAIEELQLDDVIAAKASGNRDMLFIHELFYPEAFHPEKTRFQSDICVAFLSDIHCGSDRHLGSSFQHFLDWLRSDDMLARKIRYVFFSGDNVDGVGIFPGQERVLKLKSMREQYGLLASYLRQVPSTVTMFMCPGQHDAVRVAEPQPLIDKRYASDLYAIENLVLVTNPALVTLLEGEREFNILMYHGASIHTFINEIPALRSMKAHRTPAKAVRHMLKRRHLAPTHSSVVYIPGAEDSLIIREVPDVLCTGEVHRLDIESYNGVLIITGSCWQAQTPFEEKVGNEPDPCKVPVLNLQTRELKVLDFTSEEQP